jgi:hypothetical protein
MTTERLEHELSDLLRGLSPLEKALLLNQAIREIYGGEWTIEAHADGGFSIRPRYRGASRE